MPQRNFAPARSFHCGADEGTRSTRVPTVRTAMERAIRIPRGKPRGYKWAMVVVRLVWAIRMLFGFRLTTQLIADHLHIFAVFFGYWNYLRRRVLARRRSWADCAGSEASVA